nr:MAG TPA: hypothetical protein [Bacteriophage sp.]
MPEKQGECYENIRRTSFRNRGRRIQISRPRPPQ